MRHTPYRWLDPVQLCRHLLPRDEIVAVKYFTAHVKALPHDPGAPTRQQIYLRALGTLPEVEVHLGHFLRGKIWAPLAVGQVGGADPTGGGLRRRLRRALGGTDLLKLKEDRAPLLRVWKTEEKGSDVNLASHLLTDGFDGAFEGAAVISNDSDLEWPIRYVRERLGKTVAILNPHKHRNARLAPNPMPEGSIYRPIRAGAVAASQLPDELADDLGILRRPEGWDQPKKR